MSLVAKKLNYASRMQQAIETIESARSTLRSLKIEAIDNGWNQASFDPSLFVNTAIPHLSADLLVAGIALADALDGGGAGALSEAHRQTIAKFRG